MSAVANSFTMPPFVATGQAQWIWSDLADPNPRNRFTWFRHVTWLEAAPDDARVLFAADSNAWLWINGQVLRRKVTRYHEPRITGELVDAGPWLRPGANVILVRHHNWGEIPTFQRTGNVHAGLYFESAWACSSAEWHWHIAPEYLAHTEQVIGVCDEARRIRYPIVHDARLAPDWPLHDPEWSPTDWSRACIVEHGPWPSRPEMVETPGQREHLLEVPALLAGGHALAPAVEGVHGIATALAQARCQPDSSLEAEVRAWLCGQAPLRITGRPGQRFYLTFDFQVPVHGFPHLELVASLPGIRMDLGYGEVVSAIYDGATLVTPEGWIDPQRIAGQGYADRVLTTEGPCSLTLPDERTARWWTLHIEFPACGEVQLLKLGFWKSQYPIEPVGSFHCGDDRVDQITKLCLVHAEVTMSDAYVDTPGREDGQWIEDARPRALLAERWFGDHALRRMMIRSFAQGQGPDGNFHPFFPSNFPAYPACYDWSVQWPGVLYDDFLWTGRTELIERYFEHLCKYWTLIASEVDAEGIWHQTRVLADVRNSLLPVENGSSGIVTPWIIDRLRLSERMARAIGQQAVADAWEKLAERMTTAFRKHHLVRQSDQPLHVADRYQPGRPELARGVCQAGQLMAIRAGLVTDAEARMMLDYAFPDPDGSPPRDMPRWNNPTWSYRALRVLVDHGLAERAVRHLRERYAPYLPGHPANPTPLKLQGPWGGPLPEYWVNRVDLGLKPGEICYQQPVDETGSHGWGSVPLLWLHDSLLGVRLAEPGGGRIRVAPQTGGLPYVTGVTCTPRGLVAVHYDPKALRLWVELPARVEAELVFPAECRGNIKVQHPEGEVTCTTQARVWLRGPGRYEARCVRRWADADPENYSGDRVAKKSAHP